MYVWGGSYCDLCMYGRSLTLVSVCMGWALLWLVYVWGEWMILILKHGGSSDSKLHELESFYSSLIVFTVYNTQTFFSFFFCSNGRSYTVKEICVQKKKALGFM